MYTVYSIYISIVSYYTMQNTKVYGCKSGDLRPALVVKPASLPDYIYERTKIVFV